jgi:hypothetical protein
MLSHLISTILDACYLRVCVKTPIVCDIDRFLLTLQVQRV